MFNQNFWFFHHLHDIAMWRILVNELSCPVMMNCEMISFQTMRSEGQYFTIHHLAWCGMELILLVSLLKLDLVFHVNDNFGISQSGDMRKNSCTIFIENSRCDLGSQSEWSSIFPRFIFESTLFHQFSDQLTISESNRRISVSLNPHNPKIVIQKVADQFWHSTECHSSVTFQKLLLSVTPSGNWRLISSPLPHLTRVISLFTGMHRGRWMNFGSECEFLKQNCPVILQLLSTSQNFVRPRMIWSVRPQPSKHRLMKLRNHLLHPQRMTSLKNSSESVAKKMNIWISSRHRQMIFWWVWEFWMISRDRLGKSSRVVTTRFWGSIQRLQTQEQKWLRGTRSWRRRNVIKRRPAKWRDVNISDSRTTADLDCPFPRGREFEFAWLTTVFSVVYGGD